METVYEKYQVKKVINASGKMTILGGSRVSSSISDACREGASNFFEISDLLKKTGAYLASKIGVESAYIVSSASSGIAQSVAACICKNDMYKILHLQTCDTAREIILPKGHNVDYGTAVEVAVSLGGGRIKEAGYGNACSVEHVESCITDKTVALLYIKSHHCVQKGILSISEMVALGKKYNLPVIVDAAAEADLKKYVDMGADVVIYSGTKALEGPTSGFIVGKKDFIELVRLQYKGIGRILKIGKENILGLCQAIEDYYQKVALTMDEQRERLTEFNTLMSEIEGVQAKCVQDGAGRSIIRSEIRFSNVLKYSAKEISSLLKQGECAIYTRDYRANEGIIEIDIRDVTDEELKVIYQTIKNLLD